MIVSLFVSGAISSNAAARNAYGTSSPAFQAVAEMTCSRSNFLCRAAAAWAPAPTPSILAALASFLRILNAFLKASSSSVCTGCQSGPGSAAAALYSVFQMSKQAARANNKASASNRTSSSSLSKSASPPSIPSSVCAPLSLSPMDSLFDP
jgi:hypothetical protein